MLYISFRLRNFFFQKKNNKLVLLFVKIISSRIFAVHGQMHGNNINDSNLYDMRE